MDKRGAILGAMIFAIIASMIFSMPFSVKIESFLNSSLSHLNFSKQNVQNPPSPNVFEPQPNSASSTPAASSNPPPSPSVFTPQPSSSSPPAQQTSAQITPTPATSPIQNPITKPVIVQPPAAPPAPPTPPPLPDLSKVLAGNNIIASLPNNAVILLKPYHYNGKTQIWDDSYVIKKGSIAKGTASADLGVIVDDAYVYQINNQNFCDIIKKANSESNMRTEAYISQLALMWKYRSMMGQKACFGM